MKSNHDPEKLLEQFKKYKKVVSTFVEQFKAQNGRKPHGNDLAQAPEYVRVCIKNCKRIKAHLEKSSVHIEPEEERTSPLEKRIQKSPQENGVGNSKKSPQENRNEKPKSKVWGAHLNRSFSDITNNASQRRTEKLVKTISYSGTLSNLILEDLKRSTRKSLSRKSLNSSAKKMFFETMGDESTINNIIENTEVTNDDPLLRFHPELSMDGLSQHGKTEEEEIIEDQECEIRDFTTFKTQTSVQIKAHKSVSVLSSAVSKNVEATERKFEMQEEIPLSFSGLFPKNSENKRKMDHEEGQEESSGKRQKLDYESEDDMFAENDENVDASNIVEDELIPLDAVRAEIAQDLEDEKPKNKRKLPQPKKLNGLVSNNFVKIDLKKKNYIHGKGSKMTGAKYKRQEWKRKVHGKFGGRK